MLRNRRRIGSACMGGSWLVVALLGLSACPTALGQPPVQTIGKTVADRESTHYRFERFTAASRDGARTWRVHVAVPRVAPPDGGFPSVWMLDGNAVLMTFDDDLLNDLGARPAPPVLVFLGHDNDLRFDTAARYRDYTPALTPSGPGEPGPAQFTGGADAFLEAIERQIRPKVRDLAKLDPDQQAIWGHSLGGVFVLHALFTRPGAFQTYVAASPSMWWGGGHVAREADRFIAHNAGHPARVAIHLGEAERSGDSDRRDAGDPRVRAQLERMKAAPPGAAKTLADQLKAVPGLDATYREFPGLAHGPMFRASLLAALHMVTGIADRNVALGPAAGAR